MKKLLQRGGATLKLTVQTASAAEEEEEVVSAALMMSGSESTKNKHGWIIVEPRTLRANATAIKAAGIDWKTTRGMQMVGEWTPLAAAKYRLAKTREVPELRAFAFVREALVEEEDDVDVDYEERSKYEHDGVKLELFDDDDDDERDAEDNDEDATLKNFSSDEGESNNRASTSDEDEDGEVSDEDGEKIVEKKSVAAYR